MTSYNLNIPKFLLFGDSITEFCYNPYPLYPKGPASTPEFNLGGFLTNAYTRRLSVVQRGFAGYNSEHAKHIYPKILSHEPNVVLGTIFFGTNDATHSGPQHVSLASYAANMEQMMDLAAEKGIKLVVIGPGFHDADKWAYRLTADDIKNDRLRSNESNKNYSDVLKQLCEKKKLPFVDLYAAFGAAENWHDLLTDGIHFTGKAYEIMAKLLMEKIEEYYPEMMPEKLPHVLPEWRDIEKLEEKLE